MAKRPAAGAAKTRLSPPLTSTQAAELYACFLQDALATAASVPDVTPMLAYPAGDDPALFAALAPGIELVPQEGPGLGERLDFVLRRCLASGYGAAAALSSDSPTLPNAYLTQAFAALEPGEADVVLGPCEDGGYYLIGLTSPQPRLLRGVKMSTATVLADTLALAEAERLRVALLPGWYDVDTGEDLERLMRDLQSHPGWAPATRSYLASSAQQAGGNEV